MDDKRIRHHNVTSTVVLVAAALFFAIVMDGAGEDITWHHYACLSLACATACFVVWRI